MNDGQRSAVCAPAKWTRPSGARSADHAAWTWPGRRTVHVPRRTGRRPSRARGRRRPRPRAPARAARRRPRPGRSRRGRRGRRAEADEQRRRPASCSIAPAKSNRVPWPSAQRSSGTPRAITHALTPWPAWLRAAAARFAAGSAGVNAIDGSTPIGTVTTARAAGCASPSAVVTVTPPPSLRRSPRPARRARTSPRTSAAIASYSARGAGREAPAEHGGLEVAPDASGRRRRSSAGSRASTRRAGAPTRRRRSRTAAGRARAAARPSAGHPVARGDVQVLEPLRVGRPVGVVAARGGEQRGDGALELAEVGDVDRERPLDQLAAEAPVHARRQRVVLAHDAVAVGLGPDVALHVGDPRAAHVEVEPAQRVALRARRARRSGRAPPGRAPCARAPRARGPRPARTGRRR